MNKIARYHYSSLILLILQLVGIIALPWWLLVSIILFIPLSTSIVFFLIFTYCFLTTPDMDGATNKTFDIITKFSDWLSEHSEE